MAGPRDQRCCPGKRRRQVDREPLQQRLHGAYRVVRERVGEMLGAVAESVVGAQVIRAYAVQGRGAALVEQVEGDHWNVVGLPVSALVDALSEALPTAP